MAQRVRRLFFTQCVRNLTTVSTPTRVKAVIRNHTVQTMGVQASTSKKRVLSKVDSISGPLSVEDRWNRDKQFEHWDMGVCKVPNFVLQQNFKFDTGRKLWVRPAYASRDGKEETSQNTPYAVNAPWREIVSSNGRTYYYN